MAIRRKLIRDIVEKLLQEHKIKDAPINLDAIAKSNKIEIKRDNVDDELSGFLFRDAKKKTAIIGVNRSHHRNRQRFTIAHEIGHFLLHEGKPVHFDGRRIGATINHRDTESAKGEDEDEREANLFAAELLMPAMFLTRDLKGKDFDLLGDGKFLSDLAKKYEVSVQALTFRLTSLKYVDL